MLVATPALADGVADPVAYVKQGYAHLMQNKNLPDEKANITPRLKALFALEEKDAGGEVGRLDFDYWANGQDWHISKLAVKAVPVEGAKDREIVFATFHNIDRDEEIHFYFEKSGGRRS